MSGQKNSLGKEDFVLEVLNGTSESFPKELSLITEEKSRKEVNQGGSAPFAIEKYGRRR